MESYTALIERSEDGRFFAEVIELPGCITSGDTIDDVLEQVAEAIQFFLGRKEKLKITDEFIGLQRLEVTHAERTAF